MPINHMMSDSEAALARHLHAVIEIDNHANRDSLRQLFKHPIFIPRYDISLKMERELALERLRMITDSKLISVLDFERNPLNIFAGSLEIVASILDEMQMRQNLFST
jgi:acyl-CoA oxidase